MNINAVGVVVPLAADGELLRVVVESFEEAGLSIKNNGPNAFDQFEVWVKHHKDGPEVRLATLAADYSTPLWPLRRTVGTPVTLANGVSASLFLNVAGIHTLILKGSAATGAGTCDIQGQVT